VSAVEGLNAAASGLLADDRWQQVIMNNIANLSTPGFAQSSGELQAFPSQLLESYLYGSDGAGATPLGTVTPGVLFQEAAPDFAPGVIQTTGQPLDLAIQDPDEPGTSVAALAGPGGTAQTVRTLSFVVGKGGVIETSTGAPIVPVDSAGAPLANLRVVVNPLYKGLGLFGEDGTPIVDNANGQPSYRIISTTGAPVPADAHVVTQDSVTGGVHSFFAVENTAANGQTEIALTRDGHMQVGADHFLYDSAGQRVLAVGAGGQPILNSAIYLNPAYTGQQIFGPDCAPLVDKAGNPSYEIVTAAGKPLAGAVFAPTAVDVATIQPLGQGDFLPTAVTRYRTSRATMQAGALESSNASDTQNMVDMLTVYRNFQADEQITQTIDTTLQELVTQVGVVPGL
jgi:flagellar hook protein FlgE